MNHPCIIPYHRDQLSQQGYVLDGKSYHMHAWRLSCSTTKQQVFQSMYDDRCLCFMHWATGQGIDLLGSTAAQIATFLYYLLDTIGLSPQTIKGYRSCLPSVICHTGSAALSPQTIKGYRSCLPSVLCHTGNAAEV